MKIEKLYARKGFLDTKISLLQQELNQINNDIMNQLTTEAKKK